MRKKSSHWHLGSDLTSQPGLHVPCWMSKISHSINIRQGFCDLDRSRQKQDHFIITPEHRQEMSIFQPQNSKSPHFRLPWGTAVCVSSTASCFSVNLWIRFIERFYHKSSPASGKLQSSPSPCFIELPPKSSCRAEIPKQGFLLIVLVKCPQLSWNACSLTMNNKPNGLPTGVLLVVSGWKALTTHNIGSKWERHFSVVTLLD